MVSLEDDGITPITEEEPCPTPSGSKESFGVSRETSEIHDESVFYKRDEKLFRHIVEDDGDENNHTRHGIYLDEPPQEFLVNIPKGAEDTSMALEMDSSDGMTLLVKKIWPGPVLDWNKTHRGMQHDIRAFDRIIEVNDVRGDNKDLMKEMMRRGSHVEMVVRRPQEYEISIRKATRTDPLGIIFVNLNRMDNDGNPTTVLLITKVEEGGLVHKWNREHWQSPVRKHDRVIQVNSARGDAKNLLDMILNEQNLDIVLEH